MLVGNLIAKSVPDMDMMKMIESNELSVSNRKNIFIFAGFWGFGVLGF